jgi:hypothetical protein
VLIIKMKKPCYLLKNYLSLLSPRKQYGKVMKKIMIVIAAVVLVIAFASSCKSTKKCAAYGEAQRYQKETRY